jgi:death on curing protein
VKEPRWVTKNGVPLLHARALVRYGGREGIRDEGALESALARPKNLFAYQDVVDVAQLGAAYVFGIARNHPFVDGNKRAAFATLGVFLTKNNQRLLADEVDATRKMLAVAAGELTEDALSVWIREHLVIREKAE